MYRDANNQFWANNLTYYGMSNGYWIASVNGASRHVPGLPGHAAKLRRPVFQGADPHA